MGTQAPEPPIFENDVKPASSTVPSGRPRGRPRKRAKDDDNDDYVDSSYGARVVSTSSSRNLDGTGNTQDDANDNPDASGADEGGRKYGLRNSASKRRKILDFESDGDEGGGSEDEDAADKDEVSDAGSGSDRDTDASLGAEARGAKKARCTFSFSIFDLIFRFPHLFAHFWAIWPGFVFRAKMLLRAARLLCRNIQAASEICSLGMFFVGIFMFSGVVTHVPFCGPQFT